MSFADLIFTTATEGSVLIKNEGKMLPLKKGDSVCVFGRCQKDFHKSGMGSGGSVHVLYSTVLIDELLKAENSETAVFDRNLVNIYEEWNKENPFDNGGGRWAGEPWSQKEMPVSKEMAARFARENSKAVYVIGRNAGEDKDLQAVKGSWYLSETEYDNLVNICSAFDEVAVVFNTCGIMDTSFINDSAFNGHIKAAAYVWMGGMEAGHSAAALLMGKENFSGKLSDTIAKIEDYPSTKNFGNEKENIYEEDIFVGYRYFNTFAKDRILYPFGFGLSYTEFKTQITECTADSLTVTIKAEITNTGSCSGKETLEVYLNAPEGKLGKASRVLAGFAKTHLLEKGQKETVTVRFNIEDFASYDDSGITGFEHSWVLEEGQYYIYAGSDSLNAEKLSFGNNDSISIGRTYAVKKCSQAGAPFKEFKRLKNENGNAVYENVPLNKNNLEKIIKENLPKEIPFTGNKGISFDDVKKDRNLMNDFIAQLDVKQLATIVRGEGMMSAKVTMGITAAYGGLSESLHDDYKIPVAGCADGPSGIRVDTGREASLMPIGTQIACTWNPELIEELFIEEGKELVRYEIDSLLGPGINIHRNPLNGRNFEYLSEDPFLTGIIAAAEIRGLKKGGSSGTIKHYACNSQELCRNSSDSVLSERALREIYLKGFEIVVKDGNLVSLMTSYNPINGHWAASNYETVAMILRNEWKYEGLVMTDWWAKMNHCVKGGDATIKNAAYMIRARNDIYMIVDNDGAENNQYGDNIEECLSNGELTLGELQLCVKNILNFILQAPVSKRPLRALKEILEFNTECTEAPSGAKLVKEKEDFTPDENTWLTVDHKGVYNISGTYIKESDDLSQSVTNIMIDGKPASSLECRSTAGVFTTVNASQVILNPGTYHVTLEHTKPGITVSRISFNSQVITPVSMGVIK